jgi:hypothetical protein
MSESFLFLAILRLRSHHSSVFSRQQILKTDDRRLHEPQRSQIKPRSRAPLDSRGRLSLHGLWLGAFSNGAEEALAFEMQNDLLRRFLGRQIRRVDDDLGILGLFVRI